MGNQQPGSYTAAPADSSSSSGNGRAAGHAAAAEIPAVFTSHRINPQPQRLSVPTPSDARPRTPEGGRPRSRSGSGSRMLRRPRSVSPVGGTVDASSPKRLSASTSSEALWLPPPPLAQPSPGLARRSFRLQWDRPPGSGQDDSTATITATTQALGSASAPPPPRAGHAMCAIGPHQVLVFGGAGRLLLDDWAIYDLRRGAWVPLPRRQPAPPPSKHHTLTDCGGSFALLFGGYMSFTSAALWRYEYARRTWTHLPPPPAFVPGESLLPPAPRRLTEALAQPTAGQSVIDLVASTRFDGVAGATSAPEPLSLQQWPLSRFGHSACFVPPRTLVVFGGFIHRAARLCNQLWLLDTVDFTWRFVLPESGKDGPCARMFHSAVALNGRPQVLVIGGEDADGRALRDTWLLDLPTLSWSTVALQRSLGEVSHASAVALPADWGVLILHGGRETEVWHLPDSLHGWKRRSFRSGETRPVGLYDATASPVYDEAGTPCILVFGGSAIPGGSPNSQLLLLRPSDDWPATAAAGPTAAAINANPADGAVAAVPPAQTQEPRVQRVYVKAAPGAI